MFQVLLQYFEDRFASFFVDEPLSNYQDLLDRVKKAVPMFKGVDDQQIIISYKDLSLQTFINIDRDESLHVSEAFRNASNCGSDIYRRVYLKVRESDSPFLLKRRSDSKEASTESMSSTKQPKSLLSSFASSVNSERSAVADACDWKKSKGNQLSQKLQSLSDSKLAIETHIRELEIDVVEPPRVGSYATMICGNCHIRGHRAEGNRGGSCKSPPCQSFISCGQKKKHPEHTEEIRKMKKQLKEVQKEIDTVTMEKKNFDSFQSKSISAFSSAVTPRLIKAFPEKYSLKTAQGKLQLQKDIATLRLACCNEIPSRADTSDRELFTSLLDKQKEIINEVYVPVDVKTNANGNQTTVNFAVSPVRAERRNKRSRSPSSGSSEESESSRERKRKRRKKKYRHKKSRSKKSRKKHRTNDSFSESEDDRSRSDTTKANVENATADSRKCSLDELATIATAITFQNNGGES